MSWVLFVAIAIVWYLIVGTGYTLYQHRRWHDEAQMAKEQDTREFLATVCVMIFAWLPLAIVQVHDDFRYYRNRAEYDARHYRQ